MVWMSASAYAAQLVTCEVAQDAAKTSLLLTVNGDFTHKVFFLNNPSRVVVDLNNTRLGAPINQASLTTPLIRKVRSGQSATNTLRLVFDVAQNVKIKSSPWQAKGNFKGIKIELQSEKSPSIVGQVKPQIAKKIPKVTPVPVIKTAIPNQKPIKISNRPPKSLRDVIVVLDAGHGGKDPGAKGPRASREKDVVLAITMKLKQLIDREPGMRAVLTRSGDYYVGLRNRLDIARKYNGDVFVSIHADAFNNPHSNGASVFALSQSGATSEAARWIAEKENYSELGGVNLGDLDDQNGVVRSVLIDLSQTATINSGLQMGGRVLSQLERFTALHNNKVEQARFMVLKSPDIPSILVETGFISNPREERNLTDFAYQTRLSQAVFHGIKGYFWESPPHGTRIEAMASSRFHLVKSGETIPLIAARYGVTAAALQSLNHLPTQMTLKPGQKLVVPPAWA
jgi:N-acetylmuramoyl-L-alanine amidase